MINKIKNALEARLTELEAKEENMDILTRRLELIGALLTINKIEKENMYQQKREKMGKIKNGKDKQMGKKKI